MIKNFAIFTFSFEGAPVALKLKEEGYNVKVGVIENRDDIYTSKEKFEPEEPEWKSRRLKTLDGMVDKMNAHKLVEFLKSIPENEREEWYIYPDMNYCWKFTQELMGLGFNGQFPTEQDRIFEVDRDLAKDFVSEHYSQIEQNKVFEFSKIDEIEDFDFGEEIYVLKGKNEDAPTVLPKSDDPELAIEEIKSALEKDKTLFENGGFILEVKISDAVEHTVQGVWNNGELVYVMNDIEAKPKGAGDTGQMTGCSSDLTFNIELDDELANIGLPDIVYEMAKEHEGVFVWDASLLISRRTGKIYFGEFCSNRLGYNCFYTELARLEKVSDWFNNVSQNVNPYDNAIGEFSGSVRVFSDEFEAVKDKVYPKPDIEIHYKGEGGFWPMDVYMKDGKLLTAGYSEDVCVFTAVGDDVTELAENLYRNLDNFTISAKKWTYRYRGDYTATDYPTSIVNRFEYGNDYFYEKTPFNKEDDDKDKISEIKKKLEMGYKNKLDNEIGKMKKKVEAIINEPD